MTIDGGAEYRELADGNWENNKFAAAANQYSSAAFEYFGERKVNWTAKGLQMLLQAALCYRLTSNEQKVSFCQNLVEAVSYDAIDSHEFPPADSEHEKNEPWYRYEIAVEGGWYEYIGDIRTISSSQNSPEAYERALEIYEQTDDLDLGYSEQVHNRLFDFYCNVAIKAGESNSCDKIRKMSFLENDSTFSDWVHYKRDTLPDHITLLIQGMSE